MKRIYGESKLSPENDRHHILLSGDYFIELFTKRKLFLPAFLTLYMASSASLIS